jgi:death-on-curing protein
VKFSEVIFLTVEHVLLAHTAALEKGGGTDGLRDRGLLESAVAACQSSFDGVPLYPTLARMAATLAWAIARNHVPRRERI